MTEADFLNTTFPAPVDPPADFDPASPARFFNRELSWLAFNWRVLEEASNARVPLLERVRFLSISATNLDEFYTVRVAGLRELTRSGNTTPAADGLTPEEQLKLINEEARKLMAAQQTTLAALRRELEGEQILILDRPDLTEADRAFLAEHFLANVFPMLSPLAIDPAHPFPFIPNTGFCLALQLERRADGLRRNALLPVPQQIARFIRLPNEGAVYRFLPLEELLLDQLAALFPGYVARNHFAFRVLRDSDMEVEEEAEDLVREFEVALKRRRRGEVVRLKLSAGAMPALRKLIMAELEVSESEVVEVDGLLGIADLAELVLDARRDLQWPSFTPRVPERVQDHEGDMFAAIGQKDMLLHHPYETFDMVVRFLEQAARDPNVLAIKQTLYRTSRESPIVAALCEAAEAGKSVTAFVELKARFDEAANIRQSRRLERAGAHVVYGFIHYKTHAKISAVVRREGDRLVTYTHWGTGNYHPITARIYTDLSLFTCDAALGRDAVRVFNYLSGYAEPERLENLAISPGWAAAAARSLCFPRWASANRPFCTDAGRASIARPAISTSTRCARSRARSSPMAMPTTPAPATARSSPRARRSTSWRSATAPISPARPRRRGHASGWARSRCSFHPAGHVLGSAQIAVEGAGSGSSSRATTRARRTPPAPRSSPCPATSS
jgi:polyphosphate kinase